jgi:UDP-N-acetylmuramate dehydrogenase
MNTLGVPSEAADVRWIRGVEDLERACADARGLGLRPVVLGSGSNVVLPERIEAPVCLIRNRGLAVRMTADGVEVTAAAGECWHDLVRWSLGQGFAGLENLALIPGSVGAAPVQNIGAYGEELAARFVEAQVLELASGRRLRMVSADMAFGYRTSMLKADPGAFVIISLTLRLETRKPVINDRYPDVAEELKRMGRARTPRPVDVAEAVVRVRRRKLPDPRSVPNAGSFFRNPVIDEAHYRALVRRHGPLKHYPDPDGVKMAAAELIDRTLMAAEEPVAWAEPDAPVRVWDRQPLVLTNPGRRPATEVLEVAGQIQAAVMDRYAIRLQMEPDLIVS